MYIPEHFRVRHHEEAIAFMRANPFAILISTTSEGPFGTHVPVVIREDGEKMLIRGHVAKANPHWRYLEEQADCLMIFHGPHAYVSASNYATRENVPTWNYGAVCMPTAVPERFTSLTVYTRRVRSTHPDIRSSIRGTVERAR